MNQTASLERGYRRVLACYPKAFRQQTRKRSIFARPSNTYYRRATCRPLAHTSG